MGQRLATELEGVNIQVEGVILNLPEKSDIAQQFEFLIGKNEVGLEGRKVLLNYYGEETIVPGQLWEFELRLNRPHGFSNPGGFDYEAWLFQNNISAKGYVRNSSSNRLIVELASAALLSRTALIHTRINYCRYILKSKIEKALAGSPYLGMVVALTLGDKSAIAQADWQLFSATGSNHLFVISGLHIGMISGFCYWLAMMLLQKTRLMSQRVPAQKIAALVALVAALGYALLAGFTLPTQRALVMISVLIIGNLSDRQYLISFRFLLAATIVLMINPLAYVSSGFWLSFAAVGGLLVAARLVQSPVEPSVLQPSFRSRMSRAFRILVKSQFVVFIALALPLVFWTGQLSLIAPLVNMIAIPVVGFLLVPLCFLALLLDFFSQAMSEFVFYFVENTLAVILWFMKSVLEQAGGISFLKFSSFSLGELVSLSFAVLLLLLPRGVLNRYLLIPLCLPLIVPAISEYLSGTGIVKLRDTAPQAPSMSLHIVDVGQGLSVIVETSNHLLVYDAGANLSSEFNIGSAVLAPVLQSLGHDKIDTVVISHGDNDHAGGLIGIQSDFDIQRLISNDRELLSESDVDLCTEVASWKWDLVEFRFLQTGLDYQSENNNSCVLQIVFGTHRILLPGDIEREAEFQLVRRYGEKLRSTVLIAPHHGSKSSSSYALLKKVRAEAVVFSAGYKNSFNHPNESVLRRYKEFGSEAFFTATGGMISFGYSMGIDDVSDAGTPTLHREENSRYWH